MAEHSKIEWTDHTFNPWVGCTKISPACDHCYAESWAKRSGSVVWGGDRRRTTDANWNKVRRWDREAFGKGIRPRVFCASLADAFDNEVPIEWFVDLLYWIYHTPNLDWLLLSKRIGNCRKRLYAAKQAIDFSNQRDFWLWVKAWLDGDAPPHVWIGATVCNQSEADRDIPKLLEVPARVRFLSIEPMLGPINVGLYLSRTNMHGLRMMPGFRDSLPGVDWVICGGESGPKARPSHPDWFRSLRDQCAAAGVPFLFKQWGEWLPWHHFCDAGIDDGDGEQPTRFDTREWIGSCWRAVGKPDYLYSTEGAIDDEQCVGRVGKKLAGRLLDGKLHTEYPHP